MAVLPASVEAEEMEVSEVLEVVGPPPQACFRYSGSLFLQPRFFASCSNLQR